MINPEIYNTAYNNHIKHHMTIELKKYNRPTQKIGNQNISDKNIIHEYT